jgi:transposase InsO family protein
VNDLEKLQRDIAERDWKKYRYGRPLWVIRRMMNERDMRYYSLHPMTVEFINKELPDPMRTSTAAWLAEFYTDTFGTLKGSS